MRHAVVFWSLSCVLCSTALAEGEPYARPHRLAVSLGFGFGSVAMSSFGDAADAAMASIGQHSPGFSAQGDIKSNLQINAEVSFRYYFPYYVMAQVGYGAIYNKSSADYTISGASGAVEYNNVVMEVPILVGGYYVLIDRLYLYGAVGPDVFFFSRSYWDADHGSLTDFKADSGVGFMGMAGADWMLANNFAVGMELRYRYLKSAELKELKQGHVISPSVLGAGSSTDPYDLDFSGISLGFYLRLFAL